MIFLNKNVRWSLSIFSLTVLAGSLLVGCGGGGGGSDTPTTTTYNLASLSANSSPEAPTSLTGSKNGGTKINVIASVANSAYVKITDCSTSDTITLIGTTLADPNLTVATGFPQATDVVITRSGSTTVNITVKGVVPSGVDASSVNSITTFNALGVCRVSASN